METCFHGFSLTSITLDIVWDGVPVEKEHINRGVNYGA